MNSPGFLQIVQSRTVFASGEFVPLYMPSLTLSSNSTTSRQAFVQLVFGCTTACCGSCYPSTLRPANATLPLILVFNFAIINANNGMIVQSVPPLTRNILFSVSESKGSVRPSVTFKKSDDYSDTTSKKRMRKL